MILSPMYWKKSSVDRNIYVTLSSGSSVGIKLKPYHGVDRYFYQETRKDQYHHLR